MAAMLWLSVLFVQDVADLISRLESPDLQERDCAAEALRSLGKEAIPSLEKAARSVDAELAARATELLRELGAPSALIEDLRSDDVPGNAKKARVALIRSYTPAVRDLLLTAVRSDDDQQAIQAAFVLAEQGDGNAALVAEPSLLARAVAAYVRYETEDYSWVAAKVMLRLGAAISDERRDRAYVKALRGVPPEAVRPHLFEIRNLAGEMNLPFPTPLLRHYLANLRDDDRSGNNFYACVAAECLGDLAIEPLRALLLDPDDQARRHATSLLLHRKVTDLPPAPLVEILGRDRRALPLLIAQGEAARTLLERALHGLDATASVRAATALIQIDRPRYEAEAIRIAIANLAADTFALNATEAVDLLFSLGESALPALHEALRSEDEQVVAGAANVLAREGRLPELSDRSFAQLVRYARAGDSDEGTLLYALLEHDELLWNRLDECLRRSGRIGRRRADEIVRVMTRQPR